ncbi:MAG: hypothetical protein U0Q10_08620 [Dermatophilaceae bacterium]
MSVRELAVRHGVHRRTVRQALASALPPPRKEYPARARPAIDPWREIIDGWLIGDQDVPRKQRHTARRVWQRLVAEHGARVAEVTVSRYVAARRATTPTRATESPNPWPGSSCSATGNAASPAARSAPAFATSTTSPHGPTGPPAQRT